MKNHIKFVLLVSLVFTLAACGRMGDLVPIKDTGESTTSIY
ncbi:lipoprotein [Candidatus Pseudothioglobus singularis]|nr:lipoprotein [Candidatus Pseudothioglobus singularis]MDB4597803.1 lipoprotein [Candidatus Pseudothioglobus singularis]